MVTGVWLRWIPALLYCIVIFVQSSFPVDTPLPDWRFSDKCLHFCEYAILGALFSYALAPYFPKRKVFPVVIGGILAGFYGITDEIHQYFVPQRHADTLDAAADILGGFFGAWLYKSVDRFLPNAFRDKSGIS